jgi:hypothetical protein
VELGVRRRGGGRELVELGVRQEEVETEELKLVELGVERRKWRQRRRELGGTENWWNWEVKAEWKRRRQEAEEAEEAEAEGGRRRGGGGGTGPSDLLDLLDLLDLGPRIP